MPEDSEVREHVLIFSGFIGASALTAIILIITITTAFGNEVHGSSFPITMFTLAFGLSVGAGLASFLGTSEKQRGGEHKKLAVLSEGMSFIAAILLTAALPDLVGGFVSNIEIILIFATLYGIFGIIFIFWAISVSKR